MAAIGLALLALLETAQALVSPLRVPATEDWKAAAAQVRASFRPGDLVVAAPAWADPVMRMHLGDLLPVPVAARMDDARFGRIWVISQKGARASFENGERRGAGATAADAARQILVGKFGALTVRRTERRPAEITYDFLERWHDAYVTDWNAATRVRTPCPWQQDAFLCAASGTSVRRVLVEVEQQIKRALLAPPSGVPGTILAVEFPAVVLGRELVVAAGLHDTWSRKSPGTAYLQVWVGGQPVHGLVLTNRTGWNPVAIDTSAQLGQTVPVRFQISSPQPALRHVAFAAEARR